MKKKKKKIPPPHRRDRGFTLRIHVYRYTYIILLLYYNVQYVLAYYIYIKTRVLRTTTLVSR